MVDQTSGNRSSPLSKVMRRQLSLQDTEASWYNLGEYKILCRKPCQRVYAKTGVKFDLALFFRTGRFYVMDAWCSHMGGPLYEGDIEDMDGKLHVMCPWHAFMFDLTTGKNSIGLQQNVFPVKVENGNVYVLYKYELSMNPFL